jgi:hypothetical protein
VCGLDWTCRISKFFFSQNQLQHFYFLYHINHFFYHFSNKKITTKQKISLFYTKHSYFFPRINQICYSINPFSPVQSIPKHSRYQVIIQLSRFDNKSLSFLFLFFISMLRNDDNKTTNYKKQTKGGSFPLVGELYVEFTRL